LEAHGGFCFDGGGQVEMQEIEFLFELVPRGLDEFGFVVDELKVEGEGTVELDVEGNGVALDYLLNYELV
jgi:hypothetical protein